MSCVRIGTSGWVYKDWRGRFYPERLPQNRWFEYYAQHFDTVEINNSFYRLPTESIFDGWRKQAPLPYVSFISFPSCATMPPSIAGAGSNPALANLAG